MAHLLLQAFPHLPRLLPERRAQSLGSVFRLLVSDVQVTPSHSESRLQTQTRNLTETKPASVKGFFERCPAQVSLAWLSKALLQPLRVKDLYSVLVVHILNFLIRWEARPLQDQCRPVTLP